MVFWMMMALASDKSELVEIETQVAGYEVTVNEAQALLAADPAEGRLEAVKEMVQRLDADAVGLRPVMKKLHILEGRIRNEANEADLEQLQKLRATISAQRAVRTSLTDVLGGSVAFAENTEEQFRLGEAKMVSAAGKWSSGAPDKWLIPLINQAADAERWGFVDGASKWCALVCADAEATAEAVAKLPEKFRRDSRWTRLIAAASSPTP